MLVTAFRAWVTVTRQIEKPYQAPGSTSKTTGALFCFTFFFSLRSGPPGGFHSINQIGLLFLFWVYDHSDTLSTAERGRNTTCDRHLLRQKYHFPRNPSVPPYLLAQKSVWQATRIDGAIPFLGLVFAEPHMLRGPGLLTIGTVAGCILLPKCLTFASRSCFQTLEYQDLIQNVIVIRPSAPEINGQPFTSPRRGSHIVATKKPVQARLAFAASP